MYSETDLDSAVAEGKLTQEAADALRAHSASLRDTPEADEEEIRLVSSFNDVFVAIAGTLVLVATGYLGSALGSVLGGIAVAAIAWGLAEFFTRIRRMALPSIVFFVAFTIASSQAINGLFDVSGLSLEMAAGLGHFPLKAMIAIGIWTAVIWLHWKRFMVPISVAAMAFNIVGLLGMLATSFSILGPTGLLILALFLGIGVFTFAMWWDMSDRERKTRRSDVAFWLHLLASPIIVHSIFMLLGINFFGNLDNQAPNAGLLAVIAILLYAAFGALALIVDRRAFLVSALAYVLAAVVYLLTAGDAGGAGFASAAILIGSGLLLLSALWQRARALLVSRLPERWQAMLPALHRETASA